MLEEWKDIIGYGGLYQVSNYGNVRSVDRVWIGKTKLGEDRPCRLKGRILKPYLEKGKRSNIQPSVVYVLNRDNKRRNFYAHRLVALHFLNNPNSGEFTEVNHIDGNRQNNHVSNLEWVSRTQNIQHAFANNLIKTKKPVACMDNEGNILNIYPSESEACRQLGITQGKVSRAISRNGTCKGYKWKYITKNL